MGRDEIQSGSGNHHRIVRLLPPRSAVLPAPTFASMSVRSSNAGDVCFALCEGRNMKYGESDWSFGTTDETIEKAVADGTGDLEETGATWESTSVGGGSVDVWGRRQRDANGRDL